MNRREICKLLTLLFIFGLQGAMPRLPSSVVLILETSPSLASSNWRRITRTIFSVRPTSQASCHSFSHPEGKDFTCSHRQSCQGNAHSFVNLGSDGLPKAHVVLFQDIQVIRWAIHVTNVSLRLSDSRRLKSKVSPLVFLPPGKSKWS